jgi:hypothetical protein
MNVINVQEALSAISFLVKKKKVIFVLNTIVTEKKEGKQNPVTFLISIGRTHRETDNR